MCGRYHIEFSEEQLRDIIASAEKGADERLDHLSFTFKGGEIFPSYAAPVIAANGVRLMSWGFPSVILNKTPHINARCETAVKSKTFGEAMASRRCLIPASAFYEWKDVNKKKKLKYEFTLPDRAPMYMAGIYSEDGKFAILTREATSEIYEIHDRMPVILPKSLINAWLNETSEVISKAVTGLKFVPVPEKPKKNPNQLSLFG